MYPVMRMICAMWLAMLASVLGAAGDPGEVAVGFLKKVHDQKLNLEPGGDTALSPQTRESKRRKIARRLERMARELDDSPLEVGEVKLDGDLAAVLVRKKGGMDPNRMRVFPIALIRMASGWKPAPLPASFENSGLAYSPSVRDRMAALQEWMLREQVIDLSRLRDQSEKIIRENIEKSLSIETLRSLSSKQAAERFLSACEQRNLPEILGLLGGISSSPPDDWALRLNAAEKAISSATAPQPWRQLISSDVLRAIVLHEEEETSALVSIACLDPSGNSVQSTIPKTQFVHLELTKSNEGFWRIDPPQDFLESSLDSEEDDDGGMDEDLLDAFIRKLSEAYPSIPQANAKQAIQNFTQCVQGGKLTDLLRLVEPTSDMAKARENLHRAAQVWWLLRDPATPRRLVGLTTREQDRHAVALGQCFSSRNPDRFDPRAFHFSKSSGSWFWTPLPEAVRELDEWTKEEIKRRQQSWQDELLVDCVEIAALPEAGSPSETEARALVSSWLKATRDGDVTAALRHCARLKKADSKTAVLRNFGYEMTGLQRVSQLPGITAVHREGIWTAVAVESISENNSAFPLYPVIQTSDGPRILIEIDLIASSTRSREFLNRAAFDRLQDLSPAAATTLSKLFSTHKAQGKPKEEP